jgi:hypothetical protein
MGYEESHSEIRDLVPQFYKLIESVFLQVYTTVRIITTKL